MLLDAEEALENLSQEVAAADLNRVEDIMQHLRRALERGDSEKIRAATAELEAHFHSISRTLYSH